jgi:hypothetical protein
MYRFAAAVAAVRAALDRVTPMARAAVAVRRRI